MELKLSLQDQVLFSFLYVEHRTYLVLYKLDYQPPSFTGFEAKNGNWYVSFFMMFSFLLSLRLTVPPLT